MPGGSGPYSCNYYGEVGPPQYAASAGAAGPNGPGDSMYMREQWSAWATASVTVAGPASGNAYAQSLGIEFLYELEQLISSETQGEWYDSEWIEGSAAPPPPPPPPPQGAVSLSGPASVVRGTSATYTIQNLPAGASVGMWRYTTEDRGTVNRQSNTSSSQWAGVLVYPGTVSVEVNGTAYSRAVEVTIRSGWEWALFDAEKKPWGTTAHDGTPMSAPDPPTAPGTPFGLYSLFLAWGGGQATVIGDDGPNAGFKWVTQPFEQFNSSQTSAFWWTIMPSIENTGSDFYQRQTGTYNATTNPGGCISGANLLTHTTRHEAHPTDSSHYSQYRAKMSDPGYNLGRVAEASVLGQAGTLGEFLDWLSQYRLQGHAQAIQNATRSPEPFAVNRDASNQLLGAINYAPSYNSCQ